MKTERGLGGVLTYESTLQIGTAPKVVVVVVRCWNVHETKMRAFLERWHRIRAVFHFEVIILVIDPDRDDGSTLRSLQACGDPGYVVPIYVTGPADVKNWTRMLNGALKFLHMSGVRDGVFMISSVEADLDSSLDVFDNVDWRETIPMVGIRHSVPTDCTDEVRDYLGLLQSDPMGALAQLQQNETAFFRAAEFASPSDWAWKSLFIGRNTMQPWKGDMALALKGFDNVCNGFGGQEDFALRTRMRQSGLTSDPRRVFSFRDKRVETGQPTHLGESPMKKIQREINAACLVLRLYHAELHAWDCHGTFVIPPERRDFEW